MGRMSLAIKELARETLVCRVATFKKEMSVSYLGNGDPDVGGTVGGISGKVIVHVSFNGVTKVRFQLCACWVPIKVTLRKMREDRMLSNLNFPSIFAFGGAGGAVVVHVSFTTVTKVRFRFRAVI